VTAADIQLPAGFSLIGTMTPGGPMTNNLLNIYEK
jgi:hypothetical protein